MLTIIKASLVGSALMLLAGCNGYLTNYQTPCVQGHVCECVQYTTDVEPELARLPRFRKSPSVASSQGPTASASSWRTPPSPPRASARSRARRVPVLPLGGTN